MLAKSLSKAAVFYRTREAIIKTGSQFVGMYPEPDCTI